MFNVKECKSLVGFFERLYLGESQIMVRFRNRSNDIPRHIDCSRDGGDSHRVLWSAIVIGTKNHLYSSWEIIRPGCCQNGIRDIEFQL